MKRARIAVIATAVLAVATIAFAQKPDFSGTWTPDPAANAAPAGGGAPAGGPPPAGAPPAGGAMGGGGGQMGGGRGMTGPMTVKQTADALTIERTMGDNKVVTSYKLDGTESKNTMMGRGGTPMESVSVAKFDGGKLTITTKRDMGGQMVETIETWTLAGPVLTIESTGGRGPQKRVYKKTT
jgi:hypothetical protein